jgi:phosphoesterase RecJ-like protein
MNYSNTLQTDLIKIIKKSQNIIITSHTNPDGDAIGSMLAVYHYCNLLGINSQCIIVDNVPKNLQFLNGAEKIEVYNKQRHKQLFSKSDLIVFVDLNDMSRVRDMEAPIKESGAYKIVIDHHTNPKDFADYYFVNHNIASTGELIWQLLTNDHDFKLNRNIAEALYAAIVTDTGNFHYPRTTAETHRIISQLIEAGADPTELYEKIYNQSSFNVIKLLGIALSNLKLLYNGRVCLMPLSSVDFRNTHTSFRDTEFFVERTLSIEGVAVGILITEVLEKGQFKVSLRSKETYNVASIAQFIGGGGHINAAGATFQSSNLNSAIETIIRLIGKLFE